MIKERMLELILLKEYKDYVINSDSESLDKHKYLLRLKELQKEFLSPYVIDNALNGD